MDAKLIEKEYEFMLYFPNEKDSTNNFIGGTHDFYCKYPLSLKNCQAIKNDYDIDELISKVDTSHLAQYTSDSHELMFDEGFKLGVEAIMKRVGDNKFTQGNMDDAYYFGSKNLKEEFKDFVKTFKQTSWNVVIVTEPMNLDEIREQGKGFLNGNTNRPKLDADGCLILKLKK